MCEDRVNIQYNFTLKCNQHCSYCWFTNYINKGYEPTKENIDTTINHLKMYKINDFTISGGELSINKNTLYLIDNIFNNLDIKRIKLLTNVYNSNFFQELLKRYNEKNFYVYMAMHPQFYSEKYVSNYLYIKDNFSEYTLSILLDKRYKDNIYNFYPIYKQHFLGKTYFNGIRAIRGFDNGVNYVFKTSEYNSLHFLQEFSKKYNISLQKDIIEWKRVPKEYIGKTCINNFFFINSDGTIKYDEQCFGKDNENNNIYEKPFIFKPQKVTCKFTYQCWRMCIYNYVKHE